MNDITTQETLSSGHQAREKIIDDRITSDGVIPHIQHNGLTLCVALMTHQKIDDEGNKLNFLMRDPQGRPIPEKVRGKYVYALPGGGRFVPT